MNDLITYLTSDNIVYRDLALEHLVQTLGLMGMIGVAVVISALWATWASRQF